jgi:PAS domain S-box-containing protein
MTLRTRVAAAATATVIFIAWLWLQPGGQPLVEVVSDLGLLGAALVAGRSCWRRAAAGGASRRAWLLTGVAVLLWSVAQATWSFFQLVLDRPVPFPSPADPFYLGSVVVGTVALFAFPSAPRGMADRMRTLLDGLIVATSLLLVAWATVLEPVAHSIPPDVPWHRVLALAYPLGEIARTSVLLVVLARARRAGGGLALLAAGTITLALTECAYAYTLSQGTYRTGDVLDAGWMVALLLMALAARTDDPAEEAGAQPSGARVMLPYLPMVAVGVVVALTLRDGLSLSPLEVSTGAALFLCVALRQVFTHLENLSLARDLEARRAELAEAQRLARIGSWEVDLPTGRLTASDALYEIAGLDPTVIEPAFDIFQSLVHPDDHQIYMSELMRMVETGEDASAEYRTVCPDGRVMWTHSRLELVRNTEGTPFLLRGTSQDVSERREAEERVRFQSRLLDAVGQAVVAVDAEWAVTYWNRAAERLFGWTTERPLGRNLGEVLVSDVTKAAALEVIARLRGGQTWSGEFNVQRRDGTMFPAFVTNAPIQDDAGRLVGMIGVSSDMTERKEAEEALRNSEERLRSVVEASPLAIIEFDREANVRFWNPAAETVYGWARTEVEGHRPPFCTPDGESTFSELFHRVLRGEHIHNVEIHRRRKDSQTVHISVSMAPLRGPDGEIVGVTSAGLDVTHQRALEDQLRQAQKMEAIGRLAGGIAHDFNNILTVVVGHADMLLEELDPTGPVAPRVMAMHEAAGRAADLTDQLLAFSRRRVTTGEPADLNVVVTAMQPMLERLIGDQIDLQVRLCDEVLTVAPDRSQVQQLLLNLVVNARDAMPHGGRLSISTASAASLSGPTTAVLSVADTGVGMDETTQSHIFEPFFTTKPEGSGTGLGLSTVHGIVHRHRGRIDVFSWREAGSVFTISLPLQPPIVSLAGSAVEDPVRGGPAGTVLLVEDEATVRALAREILELHGHVVLEAADGAEAMAVAEAFEAPIDVMLTDVVLPQIPGPELADRLVAARPGLQVVFMSGYAEKHLAGVEGRGARFLAKPFRPADLAACVSEALRRPRPAA